MDKDNEIDLALGCRLTDIGWENNILIPKETDPDNADIMLPLVRVIQYHQEGYISIHTARIIGVRNRLHYPHHLTFDDIKTMLENEQVLFCDKLGEQISSSLTVDQIIDFQKRAAFFTRHNNLFNPIHEFGMTISGWFRAIYITNTGVVQVQDWFDKAHRAIYITNTGDVKVEDWVSERYPISPFSYSPEYHSACLVFDQNGHLYAMHMNESSSQIIQKYIEDHKF